MMQFVSCQAPVVAFGAFMLIANVSCGKSPEPATAATLPPPVEIAERPAITGKVTLKGVAPESLRQMVDVGGNPFCTGHSPIVDAAWRVASDGALADAIITVRGSRLASNVASEGPLIDQTHCEFVPHAVAIQAGQQVRFHNSDLTFHNIRIVRQQPGQRGGGKNIDNIGQPSRGDENIKVFPTPGIYRLECDVHRWMNAWVFVHEGVHSAVSAGDGRFAINRALSDGEYVMEAWHPQFPQSVTRTVTVREGKATVDFDFDFADAFQL